MEVPGMVASHVTGTRERQVEQPGAVGSQMGQFPLSVPALGLPQRALGELWYSDCGAC